MMRRLLIGCAMAAALLTAARGEAAPILTLIPPTGTVEAAAGTTVGWGYEVTNDDPTRWLVLTGLSPELFQFGTGSDAIFDFPILAPLATLTTPWVLGVQGLYEFTWDGNAPSGAVNSGIFTIMAEFWDADPFAGGGVIEVLPDFTAAYSVSVPQTAAVPDPVPEPSTLLLTMSGAALAGRVRRRRTLRQA